jgi:hypothetical protein
MMGEEGELESFSVVVQQPRRVNTETPESGMRTPDSTWYDERTRVYWTRWPSPLLPCA